MKKAFLLLLLLPALLLFGCGGEEEPVADQLTAVLGSAASLPAGVLYASAATPYEEGHALTEELVAALYARADGQLEYAGRVEEAAVYLSSGSEGDYLEVALFSCYGSADTDAVAEMCLRRARLVAAHTELRAEDAVILLSGRRVLLCLGTDAALTARIAERFPG